MDLVQPYYIEPRTDGAHIDLDGKWSFAWAWPHGSFPELLNYIRER